MRATVSPGNAVPVHPDSTVFWVMVLVSSTVHPTSFQLSSAAYGLPMTVARGEQPALASRLTVSPPFCRTMVGEGWHGRERLGSLPSVCVDFVARVARTLRSVTAKAREMASSSHRWSTEGKCD